MIVASLGCYGVLLRLRRGLGAAEIFTLAYALLILLWTSEEDLRLLIPLLPMWAFYVAVALQSLSAPIRPIAATALSSVLLIGYVSGYRALPSGPIPEGGGATRLQPYLRRDS
jgi:hypothetical protein